MDCLPCLGSMRLLEDPLGGVVGVLNDALREPATEKRIKNVSHYVSDEYTYRAISFSAFSTLSEPWQMLRPVARAKSPRIVPVKQRKKGRYQP